MESVYGSLRVAYPAWKTRRAAEVRQHRRQPARARETEEAIPVCRDYGAPVGIFPDHGLDRQHYQGDDITSGAQEIYDPGHSPEVIWRLPNENPEEF